MDWLDITYFIETQIRSNPLLIFAIAMFCILIIPAFFEKIRLPGLVGLLMCGLLLGPHGINISGSNTNHLFADIGKLMVMFFAGLEIEYEDFISNKFKSLTFGSATFILPLIFGLIVGLLFGYSLNTSLLIGSLLASHTLLAMPILMQYGIVNREAVNITIGATVFTDIAALVVLTVCLSFHTVGFEPKVLAIRILGVLIYLPFVLIASGKIARFFLPRMKNKENSKTILMLFIMIIAAVGAEFIHLEGIVGAFIGGLAVGDIIRGSKTKTKLETLGNTLFIPAFFLIIGTLIDPSCIANLSNSEILFVILIVGGLIITKLFAALIASKAFKYSKNEMLLMWSLSIPQVAATLAAALVAYETTNSEGITLISEPVFNTVIILVTVTSVLGLILSKEFARKVANEEK